MWARVSGGGLQASSCAGVTSLVLSLMVFGAGSSLSISLSYLVAQKYLLCFSCSLRKTICRPSACLSSCDRPASPPASRSPAKAQPGRPASGASLCIPVPHPSPASQPAPLLVEGDIFLSAGSQIFFFYFSPNMDPYPDLPHPPRI